MGKIFVWIMCTFLLALTVQAVTTVTLIDTNGNEITQGLVYMQQGEKTTEYILDKEIPIILDENIDEEITLFIKEENKEAFSYNAIIDKGIAPNKIILHPVALISGIVTDTKDNLIKETQITAQCTTTTKQTLSDATGYYRLYIPTEFCTITAYAHEKGATTTVSLQKGEAKIQDILLDQEQNQSVGQILYSIQQIREMGTANPFLFGEAMQDLQQKLQEAAISYDDVSAFYVAKVIGMLERGYDVQTRKKEIKKKTQ